jgi:hypothetical protein
MSSNLLDRIRRSFGARLTLWYAAVSILAYIVLFVSAYQSLSSSLEKEDQEVILSKFKEYSNEYQKGELTDLETHINAERDSGKHPGMRLCTRNEISGNQSKREGVS